MAKVGIQGNGVYIGAMSFPDRKKPCLVVERDDMCVLIGSFRDAMCVDYFEDSLRKLLGEEKPNITEQTLDALNKMGETAHGGDDNG